MYNFWSIGCKRTLFERLSSLKKGPIILERRLSAKTMGFHGVFHSFVAKSGSKERSNNDQEIPLQCFCHSNGVVRAGGRFFMMNFYLFHSDRKVPHPLAESKIEFVRYFMIK